MKRKIKVKQLDGKEKILEVVERAEDHFDAQRKFRKIVFRDKTKYTRKKKHKKSENFDI